MNFVNVLGKSPSRSEHLNTKTATIGSFFQGTTDDFTQKDALLKQTQYKNDATQSKKLPALNLPRSFTQLHGERKCAAISILATFLT